MTARPMQFKKGKLGTVRKPQVIMRIATIQQYAVFSFHKVFDILVVRKLPYWQPPSQGLSTGWERPCYRPVTCLRFVIEQGVSEEITQKHAGNVYKIVYFICHEYYQCYTTANIKFHCAQNVGKQR
jgi:hypothetical protein